AWVFFFSSRRRHTRFSRDWSSDVCSSDLEREVHRIVEVDADTLDYLDEEVGRHPATYEAGKIDEARFARLYEAPIDAVIDEVIKIGRASCRERASSSAGGAVSRQTRPCTT